MHLFLYSTQRTVSISEKKLFSLIEVVLGHYKVTCDEIIIHLVGKKRISDLHQQFFDDSSPTDCITFPHDEPPHAELLGEIFICPQIAFDYTQTHGGDLYQETTLYIIHGLLHLLGYEDKTEKGRLLMRQEEITCLNIIKSKGISLKS